MKTRLFRWRRAAARPTSGESAALPPPDTMPDAATPGSGTEPLAEMPFLDHLEELRWALIKGGLSVLVTTISAAFFSRWIIDEVLLGPAEPDFFVYQILGIDATKLDLLNRTVTGQFFAHWGTVFAVGLIAGSPFVVYFLWRFIEPGLYRAEKRGLRFAAVAATFFFALGIAFGYCVITPFALQFFSSYVISEQILNQFDITRYFSLVTTWAFGAGILFEMPVVVYFLSRVGLLTPEIMRKYRKYALIVVMILGALFTPPDPLSMFLVAVPLFMLYQFSIFISGAVFRRRQRELDRALA